MDLAILAATFGAIFVVELPDKTFIAALVLSTRYPPLAVWLGVGVAFGVQTLVAVTIGALATLLPGLLVRSVAAAIF
jgi:putative Ca2+/H+ antiporter (TMEM165/GDT1 family)